MDDQSGWRPDPTGRHQERYFRASGIPTDHVRDGGIESTDEDRVESAATHQGDPRVIARRITQPSSKSGPSEVTIPQARSAQTQRVLVTRYAAPADVDSTQDAPSRQTTAAASQQAALDSVGRRPWWLITTVCLLCVFLIAASFFAIQQHNQANKWKTQYHAEVADDRSETHKNVGLFLSLLASQQQVTVVTNQKNKACLVLESLTRDPGRLAGAACTRMMLQCAESETNEGRGTCVPSRRSCTCWSWCPSPSCDNAHL